MAIAAAGKHVIVAAVGGAALDDFRVQSYDAVTGQFLWEDRTFVSTGFDNEAVAVDIAARRAFVAGWVLWVPGTSNQEAFLVRAYDTDSGILRWRISISPQKCICNALMLWSIMATSSPLNAAPPGA
jgi:outer membrane protein assembly factor BamB